MEYFFILGCPRSGTTMLQQALNRHSNVIIPPETKFFHLLYGQPNGAQRAHLSRLEADLDIRLPELTGECRSREWARTYFEEMARRYVVRRNRPNASLFGEKTPEHTSQIATIREVFPESKMIFVYRDGRDVAISLSRVPWMKCSVYGGILIWMYYWKILRETMVHHPENVCFVKYEDVVTQPFQQLRRITDFLGIEYESSMAEGHGNAEGIPEREFSWKGTALQPISANRVESWRHELSESQIKDLEWIGKEALMSLDYQLVSRTPEHGSRFLRTRLAWEAMRCVSQLPWPILRKECSRLLTSPFALMRTQPLTESDLPLFHGYSSERNSLSQT